MGRTSKSKEHRKDTLNKKKKKKNQTNKPKQTQTNKQKTSLTTSLAGALLAGQNLINEKRQSERERERCRTAQDRKGHKAPQTPPIASRPKPQGRCEAERVTSCNTRMNVYTQNTRILGTDDNANRLIEELDKMRSKQKKGRV